MVLIGLRKGGPGPRRMEGMAFAYQPRDGFALQRFDANPDLELCTDPKEIRAN